MRLASPGDDSSAIPERPTDSEMSEQFPPDPEGKTRNEVEEVEECEGNRPVTNGGGGSVPPMPEINGFKNRIPENPEKKSKPEVQIQEVVADDVSKAAAAAAETAEKDPEEEGGRRTVEAKETAFDWIVLVCAFGSNVSFGMDFYSFSVFYPCLMEYFQATAAQVGWCLSIEALVTSIFSVFSIHPIERYGCRLPGVIGSLIFCFGIALTAFAPSVNFIYFTYGIIAGFGASICGLTSSIIIQQRFHRNRALISGVSVVGFSVGGMIGPAVVNALLRHYSWRGSYLILSAIYAHRIPFALLFVTPPRYLANRTNRPKGSGGRSVKVVIVNLFRYLRQTFDFSIMRKKKLFSLFTVVLCVQIIVYTGYVQHCVNRAVHIGIVMEQAFWASTLVGISNCLSRIVVSVVGNLRCVNRSLLFAFGLFMSFVSVLVLLLSQNFVGTMTSAVIFGIMFGCTGTIQTVIIVDLVGVDLLTRCLAIQAFIFGFFRLTASPFVGWIFDVRQDYNVAFGLLGCLGFVDCLIMIIVFVFQRREKKQRTKERSLDRESEGKKKPKQRTRQQLPVVAVSASNHELSHT